MVGTNRDGLEYPSDPLSVERQALRATQTGTFASLVALALPDKRGRILVPANDGVFEPLNDLLSGFGMVTGQCPRHNDALDRLGHVEPGA